MSQFDWDPAKAEANLRKHGVSFDEAEAVINNALRATKRERHAYEDRRL